jgi:hypothetical protein
MSKCKICDNETDTESLWDEWICKTCGQKYPFDEGIIMSVSKEQMIVLRQHYQRKLNTPTKEL